MVHRGWGPKALNYNVILHPEIASSKPGNQPAPTKMVTTVPASDLNLTDGLAGTLINRIVVEKNKETRGTSAAKIGQKRHKTTKKSLENHEKRCLAGLIAAAGKFSLKEEVLAYVKQTKGQGEA